MGVFCIFVNKQRTKSQGVFPQGSYCIRAESLVG